MTNEEESVIIVYQNQEETCDKCGINIMDTDGLAKAGTRGITGVTNGEVYYQTVCVDCFGGKRL